MTIAFPFRFAPDGHTALSEDAVRDLLRQVLFTEPGERVNRPDFGSGLAGLVFEPNAHALTAATRARVEGAVNQWLADVIQLEAVTVESHDSTIEVTVSYTVRRTGERATTTLGPPVTP